jgi:cytochrome oxidase Cu insertion factor (SCO1/SenC/PrrC family)
MPNNHQSSELEKQRKGRIILIMLLVFFAVPLVVVMMMYKFNWMPSGSSVGELVRPARLLSASAELKNNEGMALPSQFWKQRWSIVYIAADCEKVCLDKLHDMRQLHVSLYKDMPRAQRVLITTTPDVKKIKLNYPDLIVINQPADQFASFTKQFQMNDETVSSSNRLYLVDPLGHLMMSYHAELPLAAVRKDVTRLLRFSWAG